MFLCRHPSDEIRKSWDKYETAVLYYRSNTFMIAIFIMDLLAIVSGNSTYNKSQKFLENGNHEFDTETSLKALNSAKLVFILGTIVRPILVMISYKWPKVNNYYYGYSMFMLGTMTFFPVHDNEENAKEVLLLRMMLSFFGLYVHFWSSLILSIITYGALTVALATIYMVPFGNETVVNSLLDLLAFSFYAFMVHI